MWLLQSPRIALLPRLRLSLLSPPAPATESAASPPAGTHDGEGDLSSPPPPPLVSDPPTAALRDLERLCGHTSKVSEPNPDARESREAEASR